MLLKLLVSWLNANKAEYTAALFADGLAGGEDSKIDLLMDNSRSTMRRSIRPVLHFSATRMSRIK